MRGVILIFKLLLSPFAAVIILELFFRLTQVVWKPVYRTLFDDKNKLYIYALGESTSEGVQYQDKISPAILVAHQFNNRIDNKEVEIISLARSGEKAEYMYFRFYFHVVFAPHSNGLVLTYSGINEGIENTASYNFRYWKLAQHSVVLSKLMYMSGRFTNDPERYAYRYAQTCQVAKNYGYKVVLSQLVGNVKDYDPDVKSNDAIAQGSNRKILQEAEALFANADYVDAEKKYASLLMADALPHPFVLYRIALCKYETGYCDTAAAMLNSLPETSNYSGFAPWKNRLIERVANEEQVAFARTFDRFCDASQFGLVGHNLINDAHHPNLKGYCIMANAISEHVSRLYQQPVVNNLTPESVEKYFQFDTTFYSGVYFRLTEWYIFKALDTEMHNERLSRIKLYADKYFALKKDEESKLLWQLLISVIEKSPHHFANTLTQLNAHQKKEQLLGRLENIFSNAHYNKKIKQTILPWKGNKELNNEQFIDFLNRMN